MSAKCAALLFRNDGPCAGTSWLVRSHRSDWQLNGHMHFRAISCLLGCCSPRTSFDCGGYAAAKQRFQQCKLSVDEYRHRTTMVGHSIVVGLQNLPSIVK